MSKIEMSPGLRLFGDGVQWDCHIQDLRLVLRKTEEIEFPEEEETADEDILIDDIFPDITRKSFIVTLLIALDDEFKSFCEILRTATARRLKWNDLRGSALERFIAYSEKVCDLPPICDHAARQLLEGIVELRNCIVHNNSCVEDFSKRKAIEHLSKQMKGVRIVEGYVHLDLVACNTAADIVHVFMDGAYKIACTKFPDKQ
jgi:hypothetical protein